MARIRRSESKIFLEINVADMKQLCIFVPSDTCEASFGFQTFSGLNKPGWQGFFPKGGFRMVSLPADRAFLFSPFNKRHHATPTHSHHTHPRASAHAAYQPPLRPDDFIQESSSICPGAIQRRRLSGSGEIHAGGVGSHAQAASRDRQVIHPIVSFNAIPGSTLGWELYA